MEIFSVLIILLLPAITTVVIIYAFGKKVNDLRDALNKCGIIQNTMVCEIQETIIDLLHERSKLRELTVEEKTRFQNARSILNRCETNLKDAGFIRKSLSECP